MFTRTTIAVAAAALVAAAAAPAMAKTIKHRHHAAFAQQQVSPAAFRPFARVGRFAPAFARDPAEETRLDRAKGGIR